MNKKIILSLLLVLLVAISVSAVSAEAVDDVIDDAGIDVVAEVDDAGTADDTVLADGEEKTGDDIQTAIDNAEDGGEIDLGENLVYNVEDGKI
ncbi:MAG: hypothetical protein J6W16_04655, partial [Methanobrevibacter sp.]|nr:hypothetical protein [Methanobrevibacter sp.]